MIIYQVKTDKGLIPATEEDRLKLSKVKIGANIQCKVITERNAKFLRKYFALLKLAWENLPEHLEQNFPRQQEMPDEFRFEIIMRAGYFETYTNFKGVVQYKAKSISFENMDDEEFANLYSASIDVILKWVFKDLDKEYLMNELVGFM
jgi:hypothetical protein